jgi:hypothetical protein
MRKRQHGEFKLCPSWEEARKLIIGMKRFKAPGTALMNKDARLDDVVNDHDDPNVHWSMRRFKASTSSRTAAKSEAKRKFEKQVRFCNFVEVLAFESYSDKEEEAVFMTQKEKKQLRLGYRKSVQCLSFPSMYSADQHEQLLECTRGLDTVQGSTARLVRQRVAQMTIVDEQPQLAQLDASDDAWISKKYRSIVEESIREACILALQDEADAIVIYGRMRRKLCGN